MRLNPQFSITATFYHWAYKCHECLTISSGQPVQGLLWPTTEWAQKTKQVLTRKYFILSGWWNVWLGSLVLKRASNSKFCHTEGTMSILKRQHTSFLRNTKSGWWGPVSRTRLVKNQSRSNWQIIWSLSWDTLSMNPTLELSHTQSLRGRVHF